MTRMMKIVLLACSLPGGAITVQAKDGEAEMIFHGTLIEAPDCSINDGSQVEVNFGDRLAVNNIDGAHYRQPLNYQIVCEQPNNNDWVMTLSLSGSAAQFDAEALQTDRTDLGIRIYQDDKPFTPNSVLKIDLTRPPRLEAVPVKRAGATLSEGEFEAWATLRADYQ